MRIADVDVSLSRGILLKRVQYFLAYFTIAICCIFPVLTVILLIIPDVEWDIELAFLMGGLNVFAVALISLMLVVIIKNKRLVKDVKLWLTDAIETDAYSKKIGENRMGIQPKATKIQVKFQIDGKVCTRESSYKVFGGVEGYVGCFNKYADRKVKILYSPKYDEVLILKDSETNFAIEE